MPKPVNLQAAATVSVVTGAASGIGRATAVRLAQAGTHVGIVDVDGAGMNDVAAEVERLGQRCHAVVADVSDATQVRFAAESIWATLGNMNTLVNSAGINVAKDPLEYTDEEVLRIVSTNFIGTWYCCRYFTPFLLATAGPRVIVNIASITALQASYGLAPYSATKGAIVSLTRALALDLADRQVRVNAVAPGVIRTPMTAASLQHRTIQEQIRLATPMRHWLEPEDVANAVAFLASDEARNITGVVLPVDGGVTAGNLLGFGRADLAPTIVEPAEDGDGAE